MKTRTKKIIILALAGAMVLGALSGGLAAAFSHPQVNEVKAYAVTSPSEYYCSINPDSSTLLNDLNKLNSGKRKSTVGYKAMLNDPQHGFYVTDPGSRQGSTITTFYSGKSNNGTSGLNREHVWPDSRGGNLVENDIHMPRPTLTAENGSRGNSFYVEGKKSSSGGWDPAAESFGLESYRGDSARIIFYCAIANTQLTLVDKETDNQNNKTMGKLSDLLKWNLKYPVLEREKVRNDGAESLQGNRNPFIDHPEYACKIWGNTNSATREICKSNPPTPTIELESISISSAAVTEYEVGDEFVKPKVTAIYSNDTIKDVTSSCTFTGYNLNTAGTQTVTVSYKEGNVTKTATYTITVSKQEVIELRKIEITSAYVTTYDVGDTFKRPDITATYSNGSTSDVTELCTFSGYNLNIPGTQTVKVSFTSNQITQTITYEITVVSSKTLESITVVDPQTEYVIGNKFLPPLVIANYSDGTTQNVTSFCLFSGFDLGVVGEQTVEVTYEENDVVVFKNYDITVSEDNPDIIHVSDLIISPTLKSIGVGDTFQLNVEVEPSNADNKAVKYISYDESIATVSSRGIVKGISLGSTEIHVVTDDGFINKTCYVEVTEKEDEPQVMSIEVSALPEKMTYYVGQDFIPYGMKVVAHYNDDSFDCLVTKDCKFTYDFSIANPKSKVTVKYSNRSATFNVEVIEGEATIQEEAIDFSYEFRTIINDESAVTKTVWAKAETEFKDLDPEIKEIYRTASYTTTRAKDNGIIKCVKSYDRVLESNPDFNDFMGRKQTTPTNEFEVDMKRVILIIAIVVVFIVAIILVIVIPVKAHKRKAKAS